MGITGPSSRPTGSSTPRPSIQPEIKDMPRPQAVPPVQGVVSTHTYQQEPHLDVSWWHRLVHAVSRFLGWSHSQTPPSMDRSDVVNAIAGSISKYGSQPGYDQVIEWIISDSGLLAHDPEPLQFLRAALAPNQEPTSVFSNEHRLALVGWKQTKYGSHSWAKRILNWAWHPWLSSYLSEPHSVEDLRVLCQLGDTLEIEIEADRSWPLELCKQLESNLNSIQDRKCILDWPHYLLCEEGPGAKAEEGPGAKAWDATLRTLVQCKDSILEIQQTGTRLEQRIIAWREEVRRHLSIDPETPYTDGELIEKLQVRQYVAAWNWVERWNYLKWKVQDLQREKSTVDPKELNCDFYLSHWLEEDQSEQHSLADKSKEVVQRMVQTMAKLYPKKGSSRPIQSSTILAPKEEPEHPKQSWVNKTRSLGSKWGNTIQKACKGQQQKSDLHQPQLPPKGPSEFKAAVHDSKRLAELAPLSQEEIGKTTTHIAKDSILNRLRVEQEELVQRDVTTWYEEFFTIQTFYVKMGIKFKQDAQDELDNKAKQWGIESRTLSI